VNAKRIYRLYRDLGLQLRNKVAKRRVKARLRDDRRPPQRANETWAMDFVHDQLATGRKIRVLTIVDTFTRYAPAIEPRFGYRAGDVIEVLERVGREHGFPQTIRVDQGSEFVSRELDLWAYQRGVTLDFSRPGKPKDNAFIESLNGKFRAECLNSHWFMSLDDARAKCEDWRRDYNEVRPHSGIGNKPPASLVKSVSGTQPTLPE
jgi:putative transposase